MDQAANTASNTDTGRGTEGTGIVSSGGIMCVVRLVRFVCSAPERRVFK